MSYASLQVKRGRGRFSTALGQARGSLIARVFRSASWVFVLASLSLRASSAPRVEWVSEPVFGGETLLVCGADFQGFDRVMVERLDGGSPGTMGQTLGRIQSSLYSLKCFLPDELGVSVFRVHSLDGALKLTVNLPRIQWVHAVEMIPGLEINQGSPGAEMALFGKNFLLREGEEQAVRLKIRGSDGKEIFLPVTFVSPYEVRGKLPEGLAPGEYTLWVHNGHGGPFGWGGGIAVALGQPSPWPSKVWNVKDFGAKGDNIHDDTRAVLSALQTMAQAGGGVLYFPAGIYRIASPLSLPARVVLRGDGMEETWILWPQSNPKSPSDIQEAAIKGNGGQYRLEKLSLVVRNARYALLDSSFYFEIGQPNPPLRPIALIAKPPSFGRDIVLDHVRIYYLFNSGRPFYNAARHCYDPTRDLQWKANYWGVVNSVNDYLAVAIGGAENVRIRNYEICGEVRLLDVKNARVEGTHFFDSLSMGWVDFGGRFIAFENNSLENEPCSIRSELVNNEHIFIAYNRSRNLARGEREALALDVNYQRQPAVGLLDQSGQVGKKAAISVRLGDSLRGVFGHPLCRHVTYYKNQAEDCSVAFQVWGWAEDVTWDSNRVLRSGGIWATGGRFLQWIGNQLSTGMSFHEGIGPLGPVGERTPEKCSPYGVVGVVLIPGPISRMSAPGIVNYGYVVRRNSLKRNYAIVFAGNYVGTRSQSPSGLQGSDLVIEANTISQSLLGVDVDGCFLDSLLRKNEFHQTSTPERVWNGQRSMILENVGSAASQAR
jgi:hypothetical protein